MIYKNIEIKEHDFEAEILYEVFVAGKLQYAMVNKVDASCIQRWQVTPETFSYNINDAKLQEIGACIESRDL